MKAVLGESRSARAYDGDLEVRLGQQAAVAELGQLALAGCDLDVLLKDATARVASLLDVPYCKVLELLPSGDFFLRAGVGWRAGCVGSALIEGGAGSQAGYTLLSSEPVIVADLATETRFKGPALLVEHRVKSGVSVIISGRDRPFGVLGVHTPRSRVFNRHDVNFVQAVANLLAAAIERNQAEKERALLLEEARRSLRLRDEFLFNASHELRTPLTPLLLELQSLSRHLEKQGGPGGAKTKLDAAVRQVLRLSRLVDGLLDVARLAERGLALSLEEVDLAEVVEEVIARFHEDAVAQGTPIKLEIEARPVGSWDRLRLEQVVTNLLSNAIKYGARKPIEVWVRAEEGTAILSVRDHGIGIGAEHLERIFGRFERAVSFRAYAGLGLGLFIAREIVQAHGGRIRAQSEIQQGTTFVVELPLAPAKPREDEAPRAS